LTTLERMFYPRTMPEQLFEIARRTFDTPEFRGIECIEVEARSVINKVKGGGLPFDFTINPYRGCTHACTYCFARPTHTFLDMGAGRDFESKIVVKVNAPEVLRRELAAPRWKGEHIALGTGTDPYQRVEGRYRLTRRILEALHDARNPFSILTKGTLILRDLDVMLSAAEHATVTAAFSIGTLDERVWRETEPGTPHPKARIEAVETMNRAGIPTGVLMAPVLPGISDHPDQMRAVVEAALEAGATHVSPILLHLRPGVREEFLPWLEAHHPGLLPRYRELYARAYAPARERDRLARQVAGLVSAGRRKRPASDLPAPTHHRFRRASPAADPEPRASQPTLW
jgi:DNA repair photolyase